MKLKTLLPALIFAASLASPAAADGASRVTWQPSSSGSCEDCNLVGRQMPFWNLTQAHYDRANLSHSSLHGAEAEGAHFTGIIGYHTDFSRAEVSNAHFSGAMLTNARLIGIIANGADFSGANLDRTDAREAQLVGANLKETSAVHMLAMSTDFSAADATGAIFDYATLRGAIFDGAQLADSSFIETDLSGATFRDARLGGANLARAINYQQANFEGACRTETTLMPPELSLPFCIDPVRLQVAATTETLSEAP